VQGRELRRHGMNDLAQQQQQQQQSLVFQNPNFSETTNNPVLVARSISVDATGGKVTTSCTQLNYLTFTDSDGRNYSTYTDSDGIIKQATSQLVTRSCRHNTFFT